MIGDKFVVDYEADDLINWASTDYHSIVDIVDESDEGYNSEDMNQEHDEDYDIITIEVDWFDASDVKSAAFSEFSERAKMLGYNIEDVLDENYQHWSYKEDHGRCSVKIINSFNPETDVLDLHDEEIISLCEAMWIANDRHQNTDYDQMLSDWISKDIARRLA